MSHTTKLHHKRKPIDRETEVIVANNTYGMFVYESRNGDLSIQLEEHGDDDYVTYGQLRKLKKYLADMSLVIIGVNDDNVSIMDIARGLRVSDVYEKYFDLVEDMDSEEVTVDDELDIDNFEDFVLNSTAEEFKEAFDSKLQNAVIRTTVELYKQQRLASHEKTQMVRNSRPKDERGDFWNDIEASQEE